MLGNGECVINYEECRKKHSWPNFEVQTQHLVR